MQREASSSRAYLLMDYVQRLERHREGRRTVHIHLSKLKAQNRREHHLRIPENTFDELTKQFDGQAFAIQNGDIVFVCRDASIANMDDAVQRLRRLYEDDPLAQSIDAGHEDLFCNYYNVESQYAPFLEIAEGLYNEEQRRIKRLQMAAEQSGESMQGEQTPLSLRNNLKSWSNFSVGPIFRALCGGNLSAPLPAQTSRARSSGNCSFQSANSPNRFCPM